jgi:hypothetical protein
MFFGIRDPRSGIRDGKNPDPGSGINIPDPQHWTWAYRMDMNTQHVLVHAIWTCSMDIVMENGHGNVALT